MFKYQCVCVTLLGFGAIKNADFVFPFSPLSLVAKEANAQVCEHVFLFYCATHLIALLLKILD